LGDYLCILGSFVENNRSSPNVCASFSEVKVLASFWATFSQAHLVALTQAHMQRVICGQEKQLQEPRRRQNSKYSPNSGGARC
jgi:hypothetical protein